MTPLPLVRRAASGVVPVAQSLLLAAVPQGGQFAARRNAWAGMTGNAATARARREADRALAATTRGTQPLVHAHGG